MVVFSSITFKRRGIATQVAVGLTWGAGQLKWAWPSAAGEVVEGVKGAGARGASHGGEGAEAQVHSSAWEAKGAELEPPPLPKSGRGLCEGAPGSAGGSLESGCCCLRNRWPRLRLLLRPLLTLEGT